MRKNYVFTKEKKDSLPKGGIWGWHFHTGKLSYSDNRVVVPGRTYEMKEWGLFSDRDPDLCQPGMHASPTIRHALMYADYRKYLSLVYVYGSIKTTPGKFCGRYRFVAWNIDFCKFKKKYGLLPVGRVINQKGIIRPKTYKNIPCSRFCRAKTGKDFSIEWLVVPESELTELLRQEFILSQLGYI
jgi:hypothetical protein